MPTPPKLQPALFGGLFIGVLSALPIISAGNCLCCMWVVGGGVLATYLMQQNHPYAITAADGALVGLLAGLIGGVIGTILSIPLDMVMGPYQRQLLERIIASNPDFPAETRTMIENMNVGAATVAATMVKLVTSIIFGLIFGMFGGLLGVALFKKNVPPPPAGSLEVLPPA
ncbi:MAG TPA: hypothetical protein VFK57_15635 [Vicinamibacterales bacterium]|nr:hypothetical protein [Vicinamibacterales bacterium]